MLYTASLFTLNSATPPYLNFIFYLPLFLQQTFTEEQAAEWAKQEPEVEYNYDDDEKPDPSIYMDIDRQIKANKAHGRFERQSAFAGQEMKVLWMEKLDARVMHKNNVLLLLACIGIFLMMLHIEVNYDAEAKMIKGRTGRTSPHLTLTVVQTKDSPSSASRSDFSVR